MHARLRLAGALIVGLLPLGAAWADQAGKPEIPPEQVAELVRQTLIPDPLMRQQFLMILRGRDNADVVPGLIQVLQFVDDDGWLDRTLAGLTGEVPGKSWRDWMVWQQAHPEIAPFEGFDVFKADVLAVIDPDFRLFLKPGVAHEIRLEEIVWGGVKKDGIPALTNPKQIAAADATWLQDDELVFGIEIAGDARAYPLRILDWHEMVNDVIGGLPVTLAYCTLCGSGILYDARVPGYDEPFVFGSSGLVYRSNKLMYDQATHSLWSQFTGRPVVGPLTGSGIELAVLPVTIASWRDWQARHPDTKVLSLETGYERDYALGQPYGEYFASAELMFPLLVPDGRLLPKDYVFALRADGREQAWPLADFGGGRVINAKVGDLPVVLVGDAATRTVRAYESGELEFAAGSSPTTLVADGQAWQIQEDALVGPDGARLPRLPGHIAYWFAWQGFIDGAPLADPGAADDVR
jgi:Protein of unknown function (DUF3179)